MSRSPRRLVDRAWARYALALLVSLGAIVVTRWSVVSLDGVQFALPLAFVAFIALALGLRPGLLATCVIALGLLLMVEPELSLRIREPGDAFRLAVLVAGGAVISLISGSQRRTRERLAIERALARESAERAENSAATARRSNEALRESEERYRNAADALRESDRRKDEFLAVLSHELRNPLAPITTAFSVIDHALPEGAEGSAARRAVAIGHRQVGLLTRLVDDLLDVTRIARQRIEVQRVPLDLAALVRRTAEDFQAEFDRRGVSLETSSPADPIWVHGDPARLTQAIGNLLHNAAKFTGSGGHARVSVDLEDEAHARVRVSDTGAGFPPEILPRLFEPFAQADRSLDRRRGGLGLGLSLVKGLVELHGGEVRATSEGEGRGAEVTLRLPTIARIAAEGADARPEQPTKRSRVLVIEDNVDAAEMLQVALEQSGQEVRVAHDGPEGIERARVFRPEIVFCDIGLPGMSGYEVARTLKADASLADVLLVAVTGYASPEDKRRSLEAGFDMHLAKPAELSTVRRVLERRH